MACWKALNKSTSKTIEDKQSKKGRKTVQKQVNTATEYDKKETKENLGNFLSPKKSPWFWIVICLALLSFVSILFIPETGTPLSYIRYIFAFTLVAILPGYCLTQTMFPREEQMDIIERAAFSIGLSFAITALVGLFLSFSPLRLTLATALPALGSLVIVLAVLALIRKYQTQ